MNDSPALLLNVARPWGEGDAVVVAERALAAGFDGVGLVDSPRLFPDVWVETQRVLAGTAASLAGPCVASLGLRHPSTVAGAVRTLAQHHPGRLLAVVGRGESSVRNEGLPVPSLSEHTTALGRLRELLTADGQRAGLVLGAASGPRTITATVAAIGGVLIDVGVDGEVVARAVGLAREADPDAAVWLFLRAVVTSTAAEAEAAAEPLLGSCAARLAAAPGWYGIETSHVDAVRAVARSHDYSRHGTPGARGGSTSEADQLVRDKFVLTGQPSDVARNTRALGELKIAGVVVAGALPGVLERLPELGSALRAGFGDRGASA